MDKEQKKLRFRILGSLFIFVCATLLPTLKMDFQILQFFLYLLAYVIVGFKVIKEAISNIFKGKIFDENFLMTLATIAAFATGEYPEGVMVMWLYQVGELFQEYAVEKSRKSVKDLMDIRPDYANLEKAGSLVKVLPEEVKINDIIIVKVGEKIPLDGVVIDGESMLDTMALTGEAIPRKASKDSEVFNGCINKTGLLKIKVTKTFEQSTVYKILELVENASSRKAKAENFISKFAKYYTPIVVIAAILLAFIPPIFIEGANLSEYIRRACAFLVISCPCALVISIPLGFFCGIGGASKLGILIKGSSYIETLSKAKTIVFDKTGTLTKGKFKVTKIESIDMEESELVELTALAESYSTHPIANSIKDFYNKKIDLKRVEDVKETSGHGIIAKVDKKNIYVGNEKLMKKYGIDYVPSKKVIGTVIYIAIDDKYVGNMQIADEIKQESYTVIKELKQKNSIKDIIMLTGDYKETANCIAKELAITKVYAGLLPNNKVEKMDEIIENKDQKSSVVFVGDGINDAPVLARADVGVAMGGLGADAAIEAADVVIMDDNILKVNTAISLSKHIIKIIKQNIIFALSVKLIVLILGGLGLTSMWEAVFADVGVSFLAIMNSMRAINIEKYKKD